MILLTRLSKRIAAPDAIAYGDFLWFYSFDGDETYVDDEGATFYWAGRVPGIVITGYLVGTVSYSETASIAECEATEQSFYWDDVEKRLYVHHPGEAYDWTIDSEQSSILAVSAGYAAGRQPIRKPWFDGIYYDPRIASVGGLEKRVDPVALGLITFESSGYDLTNADGAFDSMTDREALRSQVQFLLLQDTADSIATARKLFVGQTDGARIGIETASVTLAEPRVVFDRKACPSVFTVDEYPNLDTKFAGKPVPVAYGEIRKRIAVPIDSDGVETGDAATITFKLADSSLHAIRAVDALYDSNGDSVTLGTISLANCTVQYSKAAGKEVDLSRFTWSGEGYDIDGDFDNGLDIMRDVLVNQGQVPYLASRFDTSAWDAQQAANPQRIGIGVQTDRDLISSLLGPITVSLQGVIDVAGDGRISFLTRDPAAPVSRIIRQYDLLEPATEEIVTDQVVSSVVVEYARSAVDDSDVLSAIIDTYAGEVSARFGIERLLPISPVDTVLVDEADAIAVGNEIVPVYRRPQRWRTVKIKAPEFDIDLLSIIQVDVARPGKTDMRVFEVMGAAPAFGDNLISQTYYVRELVDRATVDSVTIVWDEGLFSEASTFVYDEGGFADAVGADRYTEGVFT